MIDKLENFIERAKQIHGDKYDYSKYVYTRCDVKSIIICPEHGEFLMTPNAHLRGNGCPECAKETIRKKMLSNTDDFIIKLKKKYGDKYDYSKVNYVNAETKVCIICPVHGEFWQTPHYLISGRACPKCGREKSNKQKTLNAETFIKRAKEVHGDKYDYSEVNYVNMHTKVKIICHELDCNGEEYGEFWQEPVVHLKGCGHPKIGVKKSADSSRYTTEQFVKLCEEKFPNSEYTYEHVNYKNNNTKIYVNCHHIGVNGQEHGLFLTNPGLFIRGRGCPKCGKHLSKAEDEIYHYIQSLDQNLNVIQRDKKVLGGLELDIYIPDKKIAFEYNGLHWHSEQFHDKNYHINKTNICVNQGVRLVQIFEDEYLKHKDVVLNKIRHMLGYDYNLPVIGARKCEIKEIKKDEARLFLDTYHIQGYVGSTTYLGAFYSNELVAVMTFKKEDKQGLKWDLNRFASNTNYRLPGIASKMFKYFINNYNPEEVKSFLDKRWNQSGNTVYEKIGFVLEKEEEPNYSYVIGDGERSHKFNFRKERLASKYGLSSDMSEKEMCDKLGFFRVWDCGLVKYVWRKNSENKTQTIDEKVCWLYQNGYGLDDICKEMHLGKLKVRHILLNNGIEMRRRGKQKLERKFVIDDYRIEKYPVIEGYEYIAIDKKDGTTYNDYMNLGGHLTTHIEKVYGVKTPSLYDRRLYYQETGNYWWEQWFDIVKREKIVTLKCPFCNWETNDIENKSGAFTKHLMDVHKISYDKFIEMNHDSRYLFNQVKVKHLDSIKKMKETNDYVVCPICGERFEKLTYWHIKSKHNMSFEEFKNKYPEVKIQSDAMTKQTLEAQALTNLSVSKNRFISKYEEEICEFLDKNGVVYESNRQILIGKEIDILVPNKKIGIEFDGLKWHTEWFGKKEHRYHLNKTLLCNEKGYGLIHIFEDEYVNKKEIVYSKLSHILGIDNKLPRVMARKCVIREIYKHDAEVFLNKYHIQGFSSSSIYLGAFYNDNLIAVMCFKSGNLKNPNWELTRFASSSEYVCCGIGGKLFQYFIREYNPNVVVSFADRRWTVNIENNLYTKLGFEIGAINAPDYRYYNERVDRYQRQHKMLFNKQKLHKKYGFPLTMTETEMAKELGYDRIWDCGLVKYVWKK